MGDVPRAVVTFAQLTALAALLIAAASEFRGPRGHDGNDLTSTIAEDALVSDAARWPEIGESGL